jgi:hypothetical protein
MGFVVRSAAGQNIDQLKIGESHYDGKHDYDYGHRFDQWQRNMPELFPAGGTIDIGGVVEFGRNSLQGGQK